jgi:hypothetical protein
MKKLVLLMCVAFCFVFIAASHKTGISNQKKLAESSWDSTIVEESLNGVSQANSKTMVQNAVSIIDSTPANTQIWFSRATVDSVYSLLRADSSGAVKPDGIRIYFSSVAPTATSPLHYNNGVVVVSTYKSGVIYQNHIHVAIHTDYFEHSQNAGLFKLGSIGGIISHDSDTSNGALLYKVCNCDTIKPCADTSDHDIKRSLGEKMVQAFYGKPFNAKSEWFDIAMLRYLVKEIDSENDEGIRIYFARGVPGIGKPEDKDKARFVIVTTRPAINPLTNAAIHKDYFDCIHRVLSTIKVRSIKSGKMGGGTTDNGELCPTNCSGTNLP